VLQCVAVRCSVLKFVTVCVAVCCSVLQCVGIAVSSSVLTFVTLCAVLCCSVLQCVAVCVEVCCNVVTPHKFVYMSVLQCSVLTVQETVYE